MLGVGSVGGVVALLTGFASMETGLRRAAVSTGLSNRELQAWGSTARRLGADAQSSTAAIADLSREQQQFNLTGNAPTLQAFAQLGVRVGPNTNIADMLGQAQQIYRSAAPAQKQQIEAGLSARGVQPDLILAIKSETDVREAYNKSLAESTDENKKALNTLYDAISAVTNAMTAFANTIATAVQPYIAQFGQWASQAAVRLGQFVTKVLEAGGGIDGFMKVLDAEAPELAANLRTLGSVLVGLGQTALVIVYGLRQLSNAISALSDWVFNHLGGTAQKNVSAAAAWLKQAWNDAVQGKAPGGAQLSDNAAARIAGGALKGGNGGAVGSSGAQLPGGGAKPSIGEVAQYLISKGESPDVAVALAVNAEGETAKGSGHIDPSAINPQSGASGVFQLLGQRLRTFMATHGGLRPDQTSWQTQIDFLRSDPYEQERLRDATRGQSTLAGITQAINDKFEANGLASEGLRRANVAQQFRLSSAYGGTHGDGAGQDIHIQTVNVQANTPQEFVGSITRQTGVQSYNSAVR
ncbi:MAG: phage tail tip lysozyme [Rudaea sp.]|nr:phage tail tip lysozyme [Rudaea sp.]